MQPVVETQSAPTKGIWAGRTIGVLVVLFLIFDASIKVMKLRPAIESTARLGYPARLVVAIGVVELLCIVAYVVPRTSVLGAILLTGYLGGATATQVRVQDPWLLFPVVIGVLLWTSLYLRDERLRALLPLASAST